MTCFRRRQLHGVLLAAVLLSACSSSEPTGQQGGTDTDHDAGSTASEPSTSGSSSAVASSGQVTSTTSGSGGEAGSSTETSGNPVPTCCSADCSRCQDDCPTETVDQNGLDNAEAMAVFGGQVYWANGSLAELRRYDELTGEAQLLGTFDHTITTLAANEDAIFFGSRNSANRIIGSVDPTTGDASVLWEFDEDAVNTGSGQLALDDTYLYFSASESSETGNGGVFRIALAGGTPELIVQSDLAVGLGLDADHVFITDAMNARVLSLAKSDIGSDVAPTELALTLDPGELFVGDEFVYYTSSTGLDRISKDGDNFARLLETSESVFGLTGDNTHLYATTLGGNRVVRLARGTEDPQIVDIAADGHLAVAVSCDAVYWVNPEGELRRRQK